jgi:hypothetical protein
MKDKFKAIDVEIKLGCNVHHEPMKTLIVAFGSFVAAFIYYTLSIIEIMRQVLVSHLGKNQLLLVS